MGREVLFVTVDGTMTVLGLLVCLQDTHNMVKNSSINDWSECNNHVFNPLIKCSNQTCLSNCEFMALLLKQLILFIL